MEQIIAGRFDSFTEANAAAVLLNQYIDTDDICIFYNSPPGQHGVLPAGGDENADPEAENAHSSALATGATLGVAAGAVGLFGGPIVALAAAGIGAYTGSLLGAMGGMNQKGESPSYARRQAGVLVAVHMTDPNDEQRIILHPEKGTCGRHRACTGKNGAMATGWTSTRSSRLVSPINEILSRRTRLLKAVRRMHSCIWVRPGCWEVWEAW